MTRTCFLVLALSFSATACGSSASMSRLRCQDACQDRADPFLLLLEADFDDPEGEMNGGVLLVRIDNRAPSSLEIDSLKPATGRLVGVLRFGVPLPFDSLTEGQQFTVSVQASRGERQTGQTKLPFTIHL